MEQLLVEQMAVAQWKLARLEVGERSIFAQGLPAEKQMALLDRFSAQRGRLERSFSKAAHDLEHFQKTRPARQVQQDQQDPAPRRSAPPPRWKPNTQAARGPLIPACSLTFWRSKAARKRRRA